MTDSIVVHGLGYVGLSAALSYARAGWHVIGYDPDAQRVEALNAGRPHVEAALWYLNTDVTAEALVERGALRATANFGHVLDVTTHVVAVPTEQDGKPVDRIVLAVLKRLLVDRFGPPLTVLVESTLMPGTVDQFLAAQPAARDSLGLGAALAVCPRRDWFADPEKNLATLPRVVGGVTPRCTERAVEIIKSVSREVLTTDYRTAELTKALENALFHIPVVFLHQLAYALPDHNVAEAARLATTHWRFSSFGSLYLGFGTGGRCVPLGTEYLVGAAQVHGLRSLDAILGALTIGEAALQWDEEFRRVVAVAAAGDRRPAALVLGVAYRPDFRDAGRSPGLGVARQLAKFGAAVSVADPMWAPAELEALAGLPVWRPDHGLAQFDVVLLATPHTAYRDLPLDPSWRGGQRVLDGQGAWAGYRSVFDARGVSYRRVGEPGWLSKEERP